MHFRQKIWTGKMINTTLWDTLQYPRPVPPICFCIRILNKCRSVLWGTRDSPRGWGRRRQGYGDRILINWPRSKFLIEKYFFPKSIFWSKKMIFRDRKNNFSRSKKKVAPKIFLPTKKIHQFFHFWDFRNFKNFEIFSISKKFNFETEEKKYHDMLGYFRKFRRLRIQIFNLRKIVCCVFFLSCLKQLRKSYSMQDMIFCYPCWRLLTSRSRTLAIGPADRVCLMPFGEVRLRRD